MSERSISATPPPRAVELTFQTARDASNSRPRLIVCSNAARPSADKHVVEPFRRQARDRLFVERHARTVLCHEGSR